MIDSGISIGMVNFNCHPALLELSIASIYCKTDNLVELVVIDNGSTNGNLELLDQLADKYGRMRVIRNQQKREGGSFGKGEGLNIVLPLLKAKYSSFFENDGFMIKEHWDTVLTEYLEEKNLLIMGNEYPRKVDQVISEVFTTFSVFKTARLQSLDVDFLPKGDGPNFTLGSDTGWELHEKIPEHLAEQFEFHSGRRGNAKIFTCLGMAEYWVKGEPLFAHFGRGAGHSSRMKTGGYTALRDFVYYCIARLGKVDRLRGKNWNYFETRNKLQAWQEICRELL